ncbi:Calx-beta domain-containing protein [Dactylosporangium sp. CA-152071]|uniref:Calx-beta domain-containing protein n=1 Tax=Dactylosporangium sp. CA-152071 TaxID=3239933 RepID=UPI003D8DCBB8
MTPRLRQALTAGAVVSLAVAVAPAPPGRSAAAEPCLRTVAVQPQVTAGERAGTLTFLVYSGGCAAAGAVEFTVTAGSALPAADFVLPDGVLRWDAGDTGVRSIVARIADDRVREAALEDFTVRLTAPSASIVVWRGTANGRILDDDGPGLVWAVDDGVVPMLGHGYLCPPPPPPPPTPLTYVWQTGDGTARAGVDYVPVGERTQTVPAGATRVPFDVTLLPRPAGTPSRWFTVRIVAVSSGTVVDSVAVVTIDGP